MVAPGESKRIAKDCFVDSFGLRMDPNGLFVKSKETSMDSIGSRLREERDRLGMTQTEIGEIAGVTKNTQRLYETDQRSPKADYLAALDAARVDVNYVLTGRRSGTSAPAVVDGELMVRIVEQLERIAEDAGKRWPAGQLIATAVEVYNFLLEEDTVDDDKLDRVLRLVVNR